MKQVTKKERLSFGFNTLLFVSFSNVIVKCHNHDCCRYLLKLIKAPNDLEFPAGYGKNGSSLSRHDDVMQVYKKLDQKLLKRLHKAYKVDFDMFGYNFLK